MSFYLVCPPQLGVSLAYSLPTGVYVSWSESNCLEKTTPDSIMPVAEGVIGVRAPRWGFLACQFENSYGRAFSVTLNSTPEGFHFACQFLDPPLDADIRVTWADRGGGGPDPPFWPTVVGFLTLGRKLALLLDSPPFFFACRPLMPPPLFKNPGSAPG